MYCCQQILLAESPTSAPKYLSNLLPRNLSFSSQLIFTSPNTIFESETSAKQHFSGIAYLSYHELNCMLSFRNQQVVNLTSNKKRFQILHLFENLFSKTRVYSHGSILRHLTYILPKLQLTKFLTVTYIQRNQHRNTKRHRQLW